MVDRAVQYLRTTGQAEDGSFSKEASPAITSLVTAALIKSGRPVDDPMVKKALTFIEGFVREDGGIHQTVHYIEIMKPVWQFCIS